MLEPVFPDKCESFVVTPSADHFEVATCESFVVEGASLDDREGRLVVGHDVCFQAVEFELAEGATGDEAEALGEIAVTSVLGKDVIAEEGGLEDSSNDFVEVDDAEDLVCFFVADEEAFVTIRADACDVFFVGGGIGGWHTYISEELPGVWTLERGEEFSAVVKGGCANVDGRCGWMFWHCL